jgi:hypothetical protein
VRRFVRQSIDLVEDGFWLFPEAVNAIQRAVHADVP